jgi:hypothetical protein
MRFLMTCLSGTLSRLWDLLASTAVLEKDEPTQAMCGVALVGESRHKTLLMPDA